MWPKIWNKVGTQSLVLPPPGLSLQVQDVQHLSHCFFLRALFSIYSSNRHSSELYSNCSDLSLHINSSFAKVDYRGHGALPGSSKLDIFPCILLGRVAIGATEKNKHPQV